MLKTRYLIRLDDACPYMDRVKWQRMEDILDKYGVKPLVGIIPANADPVTMINLENAGFWEKAHSWEKKGWCMALHGFDHVCKTDSGGLNPVHKRSEFAGLPYDEQCKKIRDGNKLLRAKGLDVKWFFAPSHTFDENTIRAIKEGTTIKYISDMIATKPYADYGLTFVPCQMGKLRKMPISGYWCACYHPNNMKDEEFVALDNFINEHKDEFIAFDQLPKAGKKSVMDKLLSYAYYKLRKIKR